VLLGTSPRSLSVCFINELGNVIPTFIVLSLCVVLTIPTLHIIIHSYKSIGLHIDTYVSASRTCMLVFSKPIDSIVIEKIADYIAVRQVSGK
jgi:hypothetical protein